MHVCPLGSEADMCEAAGWAGCNCEAAGWAGCMCVLWGLKQTSVRLLGGQGACVI